MLVAKNHETFQYVHVVHSKSKPLLGYPIPKLFSITLVYALSRGLQAALADTKIIVREDVMCTFAFVSSAIEQFKISYCAIILPDERE